MPEKGIFDSIGDMPGGGTRRTRTSVGEQLARSAASSIGREVGRQIIRGVLGGIFSWSKRQIRRFCAEGAHSGSYKQFKALALE